MPTNLEQESPTSIRFRSNNKKRLKELSKEKDRSINYLVNKAVEEYLIREQKK